MSRRSHAARLTASGVPAEIFATAVFHSGNASRQFGLGVAQLTAQPVHAATAVPHRVPLVGQQRAGRRVRRGHRFPVL